MLINNVEKVSVSVEYDESNVNGCLFSFTFKLRCLFCEGFF